jgi:hypothetical protein
MNTSALRQQLHQYIDAANDKKIEAIFTLLETELNTVYSPEELKKFYARREKYMGGHTGTYTAEESHEYIRQSRKNK